MPTINNNLYKFIEKAYNEIYKNRPNSGRKKTFPLKHYIDRIFLVCSHCKSWKALDINTIYKTVKKTIYNKYRTKSITVSNTIEKKKKRRKMLNYDSYRRMFNRLTKDGVFKLAYKLSSF
jgi:hypothetical protein